MGILDGLLGMFGGQQQQPQGGLLGSNSLYGDLFTAPQQRALQNRAQQGGLLSLANSGALDYTVPFISGKVPGGFAKGLAAYAGGMGEGEDKGVQSALTARLTGLKGTELDSKVSALKFLMGLINGANKVPGGGPDTSGPSPAPPGGGSLLPQPASDTAPRAGGALAGAMGSDNPGSLAMAESSDIQEAVAKKIATTDGVQHWANFNPSLKSALSDAGLPTAGPVSEEQWRRVSPLIQQYESAGGQNIPNFRFDSTHTAGGTHQITNSTWRAFGGPEIAASMRGSGGGAVDTVAPQVTGTGAPITQAQLSGQPQQSLLPQPAPQAVPPITMPQQPAMPQPGMGGGLKLGNLDLSNPGHVLALGALADMAGIPSLGTLATGTPGYRGLVAGAEQTGRNQSDLQYKPSIEGGVRNAQNQSELFYKPRIEGATEAAKNPALIARSQAEQAAIGGREQGNEAFKVGLQPIQQRNEILKGEYEKNVVEPFNAAQKAMVPLTAIENAMTDFRTGPTADSRLRAERVINDAAQTIGIDVGSTKRIAAGEIITKEGTNLGFELARTLGSREAQMIVQQAIASNPGLANSPEGNKQLIALIKSGLQRDIDKRAFVDEWFNKKLSYAGATEAFNKAAPVEKYVSEVLPFHPKSAAEYNKLPAGTKYIKGGQIFEKRAAE